MGPGIQGAATSSALDLNLDNCNWEFLGWSNGQQPNQRYRHQSDLMGEIYENKIPK